MAKLKRDLGLFELTMYSIGIILGAGIYALIGKAAGMAGPSVWISFGIAAIIASFSGLAYAELGSMMPKEAAETIYAEKAFKNNLLTFMTGWIIMVGEIIAVSAVALGFGGYFSALTGINTIIGAIGLIFLASLINFWGIKDSAKTNIIFTIIETFGLILIIILGFSHIGSVNLFEMSNGFQGTMLASLLIFFAYIGFENIVNLSEETKNPAKLIPKALIISIIITTILYMFVSIAAVSVVPWNQLGQSAAPLADVAEASWPGSSSLLAIIALFSTSNTVLGLLIVNSRMLYGMAADKTLPKILSKIHCKRCTPWVAISVSGILAILFSLYGNIQTIAEITSIFAFATFFLVNLSLIWLRFSKPKMKRPFKMPLNIGRLPVLAIIEIMIIGFIVYKYFENFSDIIVIYVTIGALIMGLFSYFLMKRFKWVK